MLINVSLGTITIDAQYMDLVLQIIENSTPTRVLYLHEEGKWEYTAMPNYETEMKVIKELKC